MNNTDTGWKSKKRVSDVTNAPKRRKQTKNRTDPKKRTLDDRISQNGGRCGYALDDDSEGERDDDATPAAPRERIFKTPKRSDDDRGARIANDHVTPAARKRSHPTAPFTLSSVPRGGRTKTPGSKRGGRRGRSNIHIVASVSENLARETCVSSLDATLPAELHCSKQTNGQTYSETLAYLEILGPDEVLLNEGRRNSQLAKKILEKYTVPPQKQAEGGEGADAESPLTTQTVIKFVPRHYFDQTLGADLLGKICRGNDSDGSYSYDASVVEEYIILASSHAVLQYTQVCLGANFASKSLRLIVDYSGTGGSANSDNNPQLNRKMVMDRTSIAHLELLSNSKTGKHKNSLIGVFDCTKTSLGSRLLKSNLLSPPCRLETIQERLDLVDILLRDEDFFYGVMECLEALPDVEKMMSHMALVPNSHRGMVGDGGKSKRSLKKQKAVTERMASKGISALVCIKSVLTMVPNFAKIIQDHLDKLDSMDTVRSSNDNDNNDNEKDNNETSSPSNNNNNSTTSLLHTILTSMTHPHLSEILQLITEIFTESTAYTKNTHAMRHQECFALKPNTDGMMDVLRKAFLANVDDIYRLGDEYAETLGITVSVKESTTRGYYLSVPSANQHQLPAVFIQPVKTGRFIHCTTEEVHSLNARAQENVQDLLLMTHTRIQKVIDDARERYDALASLSDAIALLDMCHCFADNVVSSRLPWTRPIMTDHGGAIAVRNGRYAIEVKGGGAGVDGPEIVPNDTYASSVQNFTVITGINGSGKSTYLKQLAIMVILAHIGSYVPAEEAFIPIRDRIFTRIGTGDDQEHNISTFLLEMKETAFICQNATDKSLVLIDELGRATSNEDGVSLAWSIAEFLLVRRCITFFVTHYPQLSKLSTVYPNVQNQHLGAELDTTNENGHEVKYAFKVLPGPCKMGGDYGVEMAAMCGWPEDVVNEARNLHKEIEKKLPDGTLCQQQQIEGMGIQKKAEEVLHDLAKHLVALKESEGRLSKDALQSYLQDLRNRIVPMQNPEIIEAIKILLLDENGQEKDAESPPPPAPPVTELSHCQNSSDEGGGRIEPNPSTAGVDATESDSNTSHRSNGNLPSMNEEPAFPKLTNMGDIESDTGSDDGNESGSNSVAATPQDENENSPASKPSKGDDATEPDSRSRDQSGEIDASMEGEPAFLKLIDMSDIESDTENDVTKKLSDPIRTDCNDSGSSSSGSDGDSDTDSSDSDCESQDGSGRETSDTEKSNDGSDTGDDSSSSDSDSGNNGESDDNYSMVSVE